jgi:hypothetical protein
MPAGEAESVGRFYLINSVPKSYAAGLEMSCPGGVCY